jgi:hypothetical protein
MSFGHNPDTILQMLARSNRGNQSQNKEYIKVTNNLLNVRTRFMLSIAISLFVKENILSFDGTFTSVKVPLTKPTGQTREAGVPKNDWFIPDSVNFVDFFSSCDFVDSSTIHRSLLKVSRHSLDVIIEKAKTFPTLRDFYKKNRRMIDFLHREGLMNDFLEAMNWSMNQKRKPLEVTDTQLLEWSSKFTSARECSDNDNTMYRLLLKRGLSPFKRTEEKAVRTSKALIDTIKSMTDRELLAIASEYQSSNKMIKAQGTTSYYNEMKRRGISPFSKK